MGEGFSQSFSSATSGILTRARAVGNIFLFQNALGNWMQALNSLNCAGFIKSCAASANRLRHDLNKMVLVGKRRLWSLPHKT